MKTGYKIAACAALTLMITACGEEEKTEAPAEAPKQEVAKAAAPEPAPQAAAPAASEPSQDMTLAEAAEQMKKDAQTVAEKAQEAATAVSDMAKEATDQVATQVATLTADAANGEKVYKKCQSCHTVEEGGKNKVGPNLWGIVGKPAGSVEGYKYSKDFASMGITWDEAEIYGYIKDPTGYLREKSGIPNARSKMTFKLRNEQERRDVAAYLATLK